MVTWMVIGKYGDAEDGHKKRIKHCSESCSMMLNSDWFESVSIWPSQRCDTKA